MGRIISIHEYDLKPGIDLQQFEQALHDAEARGLLRLPGLVGGLEGLRIIRIPGRCGRKNFWLRF